MKKVMLVGETGTGKGALMRALGCEHVPRRAMAVEYCGRFIITPGEFLENRRFYSALITTAAEADILVLLQDATRGNSLFPPQFAAMFNRRVAGLVTNCEAAGSNPERAERFLLNAGVREVLRVDCHTGAGVDAVRHLLA